MGKVIRLTESDLNRIVRRVINEQTTGKEPLKFTDVEIKSLKERGFVFYNNNTATFLKKPEGVWEIEKYFSGPTDKYGGWILTFNDKPKWIKPHDACDVALDKEIGYDSLKKKFIR